jgi:hypothetical protein
MSSASPFNFTCPHCSKKYTVPAAYAGKSVSCSCGQKIKAVAATAATAPAPPLPSASAPTTGAQWSVSPASQATSTAPPSFTAVPAVSSAIPSASSYGSPAADHRDFPALNTVARVLSALAWVNLVCGVLAALGFLVGATGNDELRGAAIGGVIGVVIVTFIVVVMLRAAAELIRLALYAVTLLEDIRAKS